MGAAGLRTRSPKQIVTTTSWECGVFAWPGGMLPITGVLTKVPDVTSPIKSLTAGLDLRPPVTNVSFPRNLLMNYSLPRLGASAVVCLGIGCSMLWGGRLAEGQVVPDNPLRQAAVKRAEPVAAEATKANDIAPVRTAVLAESDEGEASAVVPASAGARAAPRHPHVHQPAR